MTSWKKRKWKNGKSLIYIFRRRSFLVKLLTTVQEENIESPMFTDKKTVEHSVPPPSPSLRFIGTKYVSKKLLNSLYRNHVHVLVANNGNNKLCELV